MKVPMGPPPPPPPPPSRNLSDSNSNDSSSIEKTQMNTEFIEPSIPVTNKVAMAPPPPKNPNRSPPKPDANLEEETEKVAEESSGARVPYSIPPWSGPPGHPFFLEVLKEGAIMAQFNVSEKGAYMFGRVDLCDFVLEHPTISRFHAVLQFKRSGEAYLYDLGSTHGTFINKNQVKKKVYTELHVGEIIRFGHSSRLYIFQGPSELMQPEGDLEKIRSAKIRVEMQDRDASLLRAKQEASFANGISWGMAEDAIEEDEEDTEEITWQNYKGQLTERQEKTREKVIKRTQKIANMKKEIDAIRAKDIAQGGLTQGQQTQIARNEQRISQIMEELESLEETLNDSIRESVGARAGKNRGKKKGDMEDEDETLSDDDEFYDRTKKNLPSQGPGEHHAVETAETLLDKKEAIMKQMEEKNKLLMKEKNRTLPETEGNNEAGDSLDAYMRGLSSQIELDAALQLQKDLSVLQSELDRILYLLKIADPTGEAAKRRDLKEQASKFSESKPKQLDTSNSGPKKQSLTEQKKHSKPSKPKELEEEKPESVTKSNEMPAVEKSVTNSEENKIPSYSVTKPLWLGATQEVDMKENKQEEVPLEIPDSDKFVDYKDRKQALGSKVSTEVKEESEIESAAAGLIIRKRKQVEKPEGESISSSANADSMVAVESMAPESKKTRGQNETVDNVNHSRKESTNPRRVLGPQKPDFLDSSQNYESWLPPEGQSGDGRTHLNDRFGY